MHPRHLSTLLWLGLCGLLTACSASNPTPAPSLSGAELPSAALFRGQLTHLDNGEGRFTPCQSQESWRFMAEPAFWQRWAQMGNPTQLYAELEGQLTPSAERGGPPALRLTQVNHLSSNPQGCQRQTDFAFRAAGHQPAWNLTLQAESGLFSSPGGSNSYQLSSSQLSADGQLTLGLSGLNGEEAKLQLTPGLCQNDDVEIWGYRVSFDQAENHYQGCGERGRPSTAQLPTTHWYGLASDLQAQVGLILSPEHLATMTYYRDAGPKIEYRGVWQPTADGLELLFNRRNDWPANERIPLQRRGDRLQADYRLLNEGKVYFAKPLQLQPGSPALPLAPQAQTSAHASLNPTPTLAAFTPVVLQPDEQVDGGIQQALLDYLRVQQSPTTGTQYRAVRYDLNDDAYPDAIVQLNRCDANGCAWLLFQGSIDGYRLLGRLEGLHSPLWVAAERTQGWHDLRVQSPDRQWLALRFDGNGYPGSLQGASAVDAPDANRHSELRFDGNHWLTLP